jgi:tRNA(Ile)-lysidine synthase
MIKKVKNTIEKYNLLQKGDRIVVALSGGPDSTALLIVLDALSREMDLELIVAHFNHGLRGKQSDADEKFSCNLAKKMGLPFCCDKMDKKSNRKGISPEDFYRRQRYNFLEKIARNHKAQKIALGHNLQDQAQTVLINLLRGSGLEGLKGILPKRDAKFIRPLIETSREEIISFLEKSGIAYCRDSSNESMMYLRNQIRRELIPYLKEKYNPKIEENLARMAEILRVEDDFIQQQVEKVFRSRFVKQNQNRISLKIGFLNKMSPAIRWRLFKTTLEDLSPAKNGITFLHVMSVDNLTQKGETGKRIILPFKIEARREYDDLILERKTARLKQIKYKYVIDVPGTVYVKERNLTVKTQLLRKRGLDFTKKNIMFLDGDKIKWPLVIRNRRDGDRFQPLGMSGRQKIKDFFINNKVPVGDRDKIMIFTDKLSVICIENMQISDRVKITNETKNVLKINMTGWQPSGI